MTISAMDIKIEVRRDKAYIRAISEAGSRWIRINLLRRNGEPCIEINTEFVKEWAEDVRKDGLIVDIV